MRTSATRFFLFLNLLALTACATLRDPFLEIHPKMNQDEVRERLGDPTDRRFKEGHEEWIYIKEDYNSRTSRHKVVIFEDRKVVGLDDDQIANQRNHEIEVAKAGATQIQVGIGKSGYRPSYFCSQKNIFGEYAEGGGCNPFGCWPPGGVCTPLGCSELEKCTTPNCPGKIESFKCLNR